MNKTQIITADTLKTITQGALGAMSFGAYHQYTTNKIMELNNDKVEIQHKYFMDKMENQHKQEMDKMENHHKQEIDKMVNQQKLLNDKMINLENRISKSWWQKLI